MQERFTLIIGHQKYGRKVLPLYCSEGDAKQNLREVMSLKDKETKQPVYEIISFKKGWDF